MLYEAFSYSSDDGGSTVLAKSVRFLEHVSPH